VLDAAAALAHIHDSTEIRIMETDPSRWNDSELIAAVRRGMANLDTRAEDEEAAAESTRTRWDEEAAPGEEEDEMAAADAHFARLLEAPAPTTAAPYTAASPVKDPNVGEYGEWESVRRPPAAAAPPPLPPAIPPAGPDAAGLHDVLASWYYSGYYLGRYHGEQEAAWEAAASKS
jgi:hypothetical protein